MAGPNYTIIPNDWVNLEYIISDLSSRIINEDTSFSDYILNDGSRAYTGTGAGFKDEDNMVSNSAVATASQQSIKAFVESQYAFKTITGITNDVVADVVDDTLTLASANNRLTVVGTTVTDTITFTLVEGNIDHGNLAGLDTGTDHSYIDQDVKVAASPTFAGLTMTGDIAMGDNDITGLDALVFTGESLISESTFRIFIVPASGETHITGQVIATSTVQGSALITTGGLITGENGETLNIGTSNNKFTFTSGGANNVRIEFSNDNITAISLSLDAAGTKVELVRNASIPLYIFDNSPSGTNQEARIYGFPDGLSKKFGSLQIVDIGGANHFQISTEDAIPVSINRIIKIGDGGTSNYTQFAADGTQNFVGTAGLIFGQMYIPSEGGNDVVVDVDGGINPVEIKDDGTTSVDDGWIAGDLNEVTFPAGGTEHYLTVPKIGKYTVIWSLSGHTALGGGTTIHGGIMVNNAAIRNNGEDHATISNSTDVLALSSVGTVDITDLTGTNAQISLWVSDGNSQNVTIEHGNMFVTQIGGT